MRPSALVVYEFFKNRVEKSCLGRIWGWYSAIGTKEMEMDGSVSNGHIAQEVLVLKVEKCDFFFCYYFDSFGLFTHHLGFSLKDSIIDNTT